MKIKMKSLAASIVIGFAAFLGSSQTANAYYEVDPYFHEWVLSTYVEFVETVDNQFYNVNMYLAEINSYLNSGEGESGKGVIGTMQKIWKEQQAFQESTNKNLAQMGRVGGTDAAVSNRAAASMPDPRACDEMPKVMGARAASGGGGARRGMKGKFEDLLNRNSGGTAQNTVAQAGDVYGTHAQPKYCSPSDTKYTNGEVHAAFGCSGDGGVMPDGDARVQSLFVPAHKYADTADSLKQSLTFKPDQGQAAVDSTKNIISTFSPLALPKDMETTPSGKIYLAKVKSFNARLSPAVHALAQIAAFRSANPQLPQFLSDVWSSTALETYKRIYPEMVAAGNFPDKPSDAEVMRFEVMRRFADFGPESWHQKLIQDNDTANLLRELNTTAAVQLYVNYELHNRMEENNATLAATLAQMVNPITKNDVEQSLASVNSNKK